MIVSEDSRVKIPCILHLVRLGYRYLSLKGATWDEETNIFPALFNDAIARINPDLGADEAIEEFAAVVEPAFQKIANNTRENQQLAQLRDWLLPLLMNGQVAVA